MSIPVLIAAEGAPWEAELLSELETGAHPIEIARRCVDLIDLLAVAASGQAVAALIDAQLRRLDADAIDRLRAAGVAVVGVIAPGASSDEQRLRDTGVAHLVPSDAGAGVIVSVLEVAIADGLAEQRPDRGFADPAFATGSVAAPVTGGDQPVAGQGRRGAVVAVWGPTGAPGRTTVAVTLADELARLNVAAMLIDADVYGGVIASALGLLDESPGIAAACRQAQSRRLDAPTLAGLAWQLGPMLRVLTGISRADRWPELRTTALKTVLSIARTLADFTVVDVGFLLESDEELSFDTLAPRRNGATLAVLDDADLVLAVASADPIGVQRLVRGLSELRAAEIAAPVWIVLNRVRRGAVPGDPATELDQALDKFVGQRSAALIPYDLAGVDSALAMGKTLGEAVPNSPLRRAVIELAAAIAGIQAPRRSRRRG